MDRKVTDRYMGLIGSNMLFRGLDRDETVKALEIMEAELAVCGKGEMLHRPYTGMTKFGLVLSGVAQACMDDIEGNRCIMAEVVPGSTFGESLCYLKIKDSPVYVYASEPAEVLWLSADAVFSGTDELNGRLQRQFTAMLASRTLTMNSRIQVLSGIRLRDKLIAYLSQMSNAAGSRTFQVPLNREDMATYMGADRSALSRELSRMKKEGIIDYHGNSFRILTEKHE